MVEAALSAHPAVMMAAVVGITDPDCGEYVHAEVVLRAGESVDLEELRKFLAPRLSDNDVPRTIGFAPVAAADTGRQGAAPRRFARPAANGQAGTERRRGG